METKNLDAYGHAALPWSRARDRLTNASSEIGPGGSSWFLTTTSLDGRPHVAGIGALWVDDRLWIVSGPRTRKSRDIAENPRVVLSVSLTGLDLIIEGVAERVTDTPTLGRLAAEYAAQGWPATAIDGALTAPFSAPSAGVAPWYLYRVTPVTAFGVATAEPQGATRWRFDRRDREGPSPAR